MAYQKSKLYKSICDPNTHSSDVWSLCLEFVTKKKDINIRDEATGQTILHAIAEYADKFQSAAGASVIYLLGCNGIQLNAQDKQGETSLHHVARKQGAYRLLIALVRCGADPLIQNKAGLTPGDVLEKEKPAGWEEMLHWYNKYLPGLQHALSVDNADLCLIRKLLRSWCRTSVDSDGQNVDLQTVIADKSQKDRITHMLDVYGPTNEFALAMLAGRGAFVKHWLQNGMTIKDIDINTADHSYQYGFPNYPEVPQPLLAAVWETNDDESVSLMMALGAETSVLYSPQPNVEGSLKPLFFQVVCSEPKPSETVVQRILVGSNMALKDLSGQTILFKAISRDYSTQFIKALLRYGVDIAARDRNGRTARDYAQHINKSKYFDVIDEHVLAMVQHSDIKGIESLIFKGYDHVTDITDKRGLNAIQVAKSLPTGSQEMVDHLKRVRPWQKHMRRIFETSDSSGLDEVKVLLSKKFSLSQDRCGRTVLHKAVLKKDREQIKFLVETYPNIIDIQDNLGRTAFHYAQLFLEEEDLTGYFVDAGSDFNLRDVAGRTAIDYKSEVIGQDTFMTLRKEVEDFSLKVFLATTDFQRSLTSAIKRGNLESVKKLMNGLKMKGDINRYSSALFDCLDFRQPNIAVYLILIGMRTEVFKQYNRSNKKGTASPTTELVSFRDRAEQLGLHVVVQVLDDIEDGKVTIAREEVPPPIQDFSMLGLV